MLSAMNRVMLATDDAAAAGGCWERLLDAEPAGTQEHAALSATAHLWRLGDGWIEILTPAGNGIVADALAARGPHLFAGGFTTPDVDAFARHLESQGIQPLRDGDRLMLDEHASGIPNLRLFISKEDPQPAVGLVDTFYELTDLVADADRETAQVATVLGLDETVFVPISSEPYGYAGALTLLHHDRLDRLEMITPNRKGTTMHRFYERTGGGLYMAFAESGHLAEIERRAQEAGAGHTAVPAAGKRDALGAHTLFLHPKSLGGMMLGLSRRTYAWTWSGHPERVEVAR